MNIRGFWLLAALLLPISGWCAHTTLSYQGQLQQSGSAYTGAADLEFRLFDQASDGAQVGPTVTLNDWPVVDGLFQVELDFGLVYVEEPRWLEVAVDGVILTPRQAVRPAPVALYALSGSDWQLDGSNVYYTAGDVGIGTSAPAAPLEIRSNSLIAEPQLMLTEAQDDYARLTLGNTVSSRFWTVAGLTRGETPSQDRLNFYNSALGNLLTISGAGDGTVGIRNSFPASSYALDVNGGALIRRDNDGTALPHLYLFEPTGEEPIRMFWRHTAAARNWILSAVTRDAGVDFDRFALDNSSSGTLLSILGNGRTGIGLEPLSRLSVRSDSQWNPSVGDGRGDFYIGDGGVGLSVGVALGGGGRGVTRLWTNGGVENLFLGSAAYGTSLSVLPGLIGINNTNPGNTLDVDGGVRIRGLSHADSQPRTVHVDGSGDLVATAAPELNLSIPPIAFNPESSGVTFQRGIYLSVNSTLSTPFSAPLYFEDGAEPSELRIWYEDTDSNKNLRVVWCRGPLGTNTCFSDGGVLTTGSVTSGVSELSVAIADVPIDNASNAYRLRVYTVDTAGTFTTWSSDLRLWAVRVSYTP